MEKLTITRRTFLKASAATGAAAAVFSPEIFSLKGLAKAGHGPSLQPQVEVVPGRCYECHPQCQVLVHVRDGRVVKVEGNPERAPGQGALCTRGQSTIRNLYHPERLNYPLKRTRPRGDPDPGWVRISWDEALDTIANKIFEIKEKYGASSFATGKGTGRYCCWLDQRLRGSFGSTNFFSPAHVCSGNNTAVDGMTYGFTIGNDYARSACPVFWGSNEAWAHGGASMPGIADNLARGAKLIVVDPRFEHPHAGRATVWLPVRPGSDGALLLSWLNVIMSEGLYDEEFVEKWTNGPVLVRTDNMELLREGEVVPGGDLRDFLLFPESIEDRSNRPTLMVWDTLTDSPQVADTPGVKPALFGQYDVTLVDGTEVECKPVFQILSDEAAQYPPERAAEICWTGSAEKIRESARIFATSPSASLGRSALGMNTNWFQEARLKRILAAITGNLNREGGLSGKPSHRWILGEWKRGGLGAGGVFSEGGARGHKCFGALGDHQRSSMEGPYPFEPALGEYPLQIGFTSQIDGFRSMSTGKPYRIAGLSIAQTNPLSWCEDLKSVYEGLMALEFLAVDDLWLTPTAHLADIVLPAGLGPFNRGEKKVIEPLFERWADEKYFVELGKRVNPDWWFMEDEEGYWAWRHAIEKELAAEAEAGGIPVERGAPAPSLKFYEEIDPQTGKPIGFPTPTGKVEIYSVITKQLGGQHGIDPIPVYVEPMQSPYSTPDLHKKYPLVLTTGTRLPVYYHSEHRANPLQRELYPYPEVDINQETAAELGIKHGDWVWIETKTGKIRMKARLTIGIDPRVVSTKHGWWQGCKELGLAGYGWDGANANILISGDEHDPALGMPGMRAALCKIYRAEEPPFVWDPPYYGSGVPEEYLGPAEYPEQSRQED